MKQLTWDAQLDAAIHQLDSRLQGDTSDSSVEQQVRLHLLKMIAGEAVPEDLQLAGAEEHHRQFWQHQLRALSVLLDAAPSGEQTDASRAAAQRRRATLATKQLELASSQLANHSSLQLEQCAFCTEVLGFGQYTPAQTPFEPGQQVLIYCEIDNYSLRQTETAGQGKQFVAELQGQYSIVDSRNQVVYQYQYQPITDRSQRRRQDFYMFFPVTLPRLAAGQYRLQLSIEDLVGKKVASSRQDLVFDVAPGTPSEPAAKTADAPDVPVYRNR